MSPLAASQISESTVPAFSTDGRPRSATPQAAVSGNRSSFETAPSFGTIPAVKRPASGAAKHRLRKKTGRGRTALGDQPARRRGRAPQRRTGRFQRRGSRPEVPGPPDCVRRPHLVSPSLDAFALGRPCGTSSAAGLARRCRDRLLAGPRIGAAREADRGEVPQEQSRPRTQCWLRDFSITSSVMSRLAGPFGPAGGNAGIEPATSSVQGWCSIR
jgi:hypothetical protein